MTARPPTIPTMLKVAPTAALLLKKAEAAWALAVAPLVIVEPASVGREPDVEIGLLPNVVIGVLPMLDVAPTVERMKPDEEDAWTLEREDDDNAGVDDDKAEAEAAAEAALVPGEVDAARDGEGADEELSCVGDGCAEEEGAGEENGAALDACVFASGVKGADCDGVGLDWGELDPEAGTGVVALAWLSARRF